MYDGKLDYVGYCSEDISLHSIDSASYTFTATMADWYSSDNQRSYFVRKWVNTMKIRIGKNKDSDPLEQMFYHLQAISLAKQSDWQTYGIFSKEDEAIEYAQQQVKNQLIIEESIAIQLLPMRIIQESLLQEAVDMLKPSIESTKKIPRWRQLLSTPIWLYK